MKKKFITIYEIEPVIDESTNEYKKIPVGVKCIAISKYGDYKFETKAMIQGDDVFDFEVGKKLADAKMNVLIAKNRTKYANYEVLAYKKYLDEMTTAYNQKYKKYLKRLNQERKAVNYCSAVMDDVI